MSDIASDLTASGLFEPVSSSAASGTNGIAETVKAMVIAMQGDEAGEVTLDDLIQALEKVTKVTTWAADTTYIADQIVLTPSGAYTSEVVSLVQCTTAFTSGSSFSASNWLHLADIGGGGSSAPTVAELLTAGAILPWQADTAYAEGAYCLYDGIVQTANAAFTSGASFVQSNWTATASGAGATGATGPAGATGLNWRGVYSNSTTYAINDACYYDGSSYICVAGSTGVAPGTPAAPGTNWDTLTEIGATGPAGSGVAGTLSPGNQGFLGWSMAPNFASGSSSLYTGQAYGTKVTLPADGVLGAAFYVSTAGATLTAGENFVGLYDSTGTLQAVSPDLSGATYTVTTTASSATVTGTGFISAMVGAQYTIAGVTGTFTVAAVASATSLTMTATVPTAVTAAVMTPTANYSFLATGVHYVDFVAPYTSPGGQYYVAFLSVGTTVPKIECSATGMATPLINALATTGAAGVGTFLAGQLGNLGSLTALPATLTLASTSQINSVYWVAVF